MLNSTSLNILSKFGLSFFHQNSIRPTNLLVSGQIFEAPRLPAGQHSVERHLSHDTRARMTQMTITLGWLALRKMSLLKMMLWRMTLWRMRVRRMAFCRMPLWRMTFS